MRRVLLLSGAAMILVCAAGLAPAAVWEVEVRDNEFVPATLQIAVGDSVHWTNVGASPHTVDQSPEEGSCEELEGGFESGTLNPDDEFGWTFVEPGDVFYHCDFHCPPMTGVIEVRAETPSDSETWGKIKSLYR